jgi:predicted CoA-binding protein
MKNETVAILGASHKPERYAYKAIMALKAAGHNCIPVNPVLKDIEGIAVVRSLEDISVHVDTLTLYVGPERLTPMIENIIKLRPGRIISNPGTETAELRLRVKEAGIPYEEACTLVLLSTGKF